jgi:hypothetical protein
MSLSRVQRGLTLYSSDIPISTSVRILRGPMADNHSNGKLSHGSTAKTPNLLLDIKITGFHLPVSCLFGAFVIKGARGN